MPANVNTLKLTTRPAITRYGRNVSDRVRLGATATDEFASCPEAGAAAASVAVWVAGVPAKKITGSTGRMQGEMPVISPPRKPMSTRVSISACSMPGRSRTGDGGVRYQFYPFEVATRPEVPAELLPSTKISTSMYVSISNLPGRLRSW